MTPLRSWRPLITVVAPKGNVPNRKRASAGDTEMETTLGPGCRPQLVERGSIKAADNIAQSSSLRLRDRSCDSEPVRIVLDIHQIKDDLFNVVVATVSARGSTH